MVVLINSACKFYFVIVLRFDREGNSYANKYKQVYNITPQNTFFISNIIFINNAKLYVNFKLKQTIVCNKTKIIKNTCCFVGAVA